MYYHNITTDDMLNGDGLRVVLWVSGCNHHCKGCQNPQTHNPKSGIKFDNKAIIEIIKELNKPHIKGITFSGGDPLYPENRRQITRLSQIIRGIYEDTKDIWLYTGYKYEEVQNLEIMQYIDVLIDGEFKEALADFNCEWRGSTNQRIIRLKEMREGNNGKQENSAPRTME